MNCFNHTDQPAVAQCQNCGKFLCKECATKYQPAILCDDCAGEIYQAQQEEEQKKEISEQKLSKLSIIFFVLNFLVYSIQMVPIFGAIALIPILISSIMWAGVPYGWVKLSELKEKLHFILVLPIMGWIIYLWLRVTLSLCIGWYYLIKKIKAKRAE